METDAIKFTNWIANKLATDNWFCYDGVMNTWYLPMSGHLTTEELYSVYHKESLEKSITD